MCPAPPNLKSKFQDLEKKIQKNMTNFNEINAPDLMTNNKFGVQISNRPFFLEQFPKKWLIKKDSPKPYSKKHPSDPMTLGYQNSDPWSSTVADAGYLILW